MRFVSMLTALALLLFVTGCTTQEMRWQTMPNGTRAQVSETRLTTGTKVAVIMGIAAFGLAIVGGALAAANNDDSSHPPPPDTSCVYGYCGYHD